MRDEPDLGLVDGLAQLGFLVQGTLAQRAAEHDLSMIQVRLLGVLRDRTPGMNQLAALLGLDKSSVSGLVDRAGARGLVERVPSENDRRAVQVTLTERGRSLAEEVAGDFGRDVTALVAGLSDTQQRTLSRLASRVVAQNAEDRPGGATL